MFCRTNSNIFLVINYLSNAAETIKVMNSKMKEKNKVPTKGILNKRNTSEEYQ